MSVSTQQFVTFSGTPTNQDERQVMKDAGFVHVTGLRAYLCGSTNESYIIGEKLKEEEHGKWDYNNGKYVLVTVGGEVWLSTAGNPNADSMVKKFCPNGQGAHVPLSNGESVATGPLLDRIYDPSSELLVRS